MESLPDVRMAPDSGPESPGDAQVPASVAQAEAPAPSSATATPPTTPKPSKTAHFGRTALRVVLFVVGGVLLIYAAVWALLFAVLALGPLGLLGYAVLLGLVLAVAGPWLLVHYGAVIRRPLVAFARWMASHTGGVTAVPSEPSAAAAPGILERVDQALDVRFVWNRAARVWVTLGLAAAAALVWALAVLIFQVATGGSIDATDLRVLNLVATLRTPELDQVMYAFTYLASIPVVVALTAVGVGIALLARRYADALLIFLAPIAGGIFVEVVKLLVARPRPPLVDARLVADGFSFPSGHATTATVLYGTLAYALVHAWRRRPDLLRIATGVVAALLIFAIGLSRVYLGVHYPSDVLAGWAAGALWLVLVVVAEHLWQPISLPPLSTSHRVTAIIGGVLLVAVAAAALYAVYPPLPAPPTVATPAPTVISSSAVEPTVIAQLPHVTETIFGAPQEPVSLVFVGTQTQVMQAFSAAGWTRAERAEPGNDVRALWAGITGQNDPAGPVAPSFLDDEPNALAFSQEVDHSFDQRHHVRLWSTTVVTSDGQPVWLATASFDAGVGLSHDNFLPTHHIAPNIDAERDYLVSSLNATGDVASSDTFQLVPPESGHNFVGDPFFTDGRAVLLMLE